MRFSGKLHTFHEDRGFGFIRPDGGGQDIFVHVSSLPLPRPQPLETLTFEMTLNAEGKKKAVQVRRQAVEAAGLASDRARVAQRPSSRPEWRTPGGASPVATFVIGVLIVAALGTVGWKRFGEHLWQQAPFAPQPLAEARELPVPAAAPFLCDGRMHCSQMTSCDEAKLFLKNCPGMKMDGDNDGIPCEQQLCTF